MRMPAIGAAAILTLVVDRGQMTSAAVTEAIRRHIGLWVDDLQFLLDEGLIIRVPADGCYVYQPTSRGQIVYNAWVNRRAAGLLRCAS